jgi:hypothetical protein
LPAKKVYLLLIINEVLYTILACQPHINQAYALKHMNLTDYKIYRFPHLTFIKQNTPKAFGNGGAGFN